MSLVFQIILPTANELFRSRITKRADILHRRLRPCRHALCANCSVESVRSDLYRTPVHKQECAICSGEVTKVRELKREAVIVSSQSDDRDPFESVVRPHAGAPSAAVSRAPAYLTPEDPRDNFIEMAGAEKLRRHLRLPGSFPLEEPSDGDAEDHDCIFM